MDPQDEREIGDEGPPCSEDNDHYENDSSKNPIDPDMEREFEEDVLNATIVKLKLNEAQALDSSCSFEKDTDETVLLFEDVLHERENMAEVDAENKMFLNDIDSALDDLQRWKHMREETAKDEEGTSSVEGDRPETEDSPVHSKEILLPTLPTAHVADEKVMRSLGALLSSPREGDDSDEDLKASLRSRSEQETMFRMIEEQAREDVAKRFMAAEKREKIGEEDMEDEMEMLEAKLRLYNDELSNFVLSNPEKKSPDEDKFG